MRDAYALGSKLAVYLEAGDVFDFPSDALVMGKSDALRSRIETTAGRSFQSAPSSWFGEAMPFREVDLAESVVLPWPLVVSIRYRPRRADSRELIHDNALSHTAKLKADVFLVLSRLFLFRDARRVTLVPLSSRNPDVTCSATTSALWEMGMLTEEGEASRTVTIVARDGVEVFERWLTSPPRGLVEPG